MPALFAIGTLPDGVVSGQYYWDLFANNKVDLNEQRSPSSFTATGLPAGLTINSLGVISGRATTVRQEMKEASSFLEEAKADISGLFAIQHMIDKGVMPKALETTLYTTYLASAFRSIRFGVAEAHGRGVAVQFNYLLDAGGFVAKPDGTFAVDLAKVKAGVAGLTHDIMTMQAEGDYAKA